MKKALVTTAVVISLFAVVFTGCRGMQRQEGRLTGVNTVGWEKLGQRNVRLAGEKDIIHVKMKKGMYRRIMFVVHRSAIEMYNVKVEFRNGQKFSPNTRLHFARDTRSRIIDLPGGKRFIKKVEFRYKSKNVFTGKALVELWGKR